MSTKKKKETSPWFACNNCTATLVHRDLSLHEEKCCPPNFQSWSHPFIFEEKLYASVEIFQLQDKNLERIPQQSKHDFVLIPYHVLQFCKIPIGDPVVIKGSEVLTVPFVKLAWPAQEKIPDFFASVSKEVLELNSLTLKQPIIVSKLENALVAKVVTVFFENETFSDFEVVTVILEKQNLNKIYCINNRLSLKHYGKVLTFRILDFISVNGNNEENKENFFLITNDTKWVVSNKIIESKRSKNSLEKLGGLNDVITELNDELSFALKENPLPGLKVIKGILIHGPMGCGKTTLIETVAENFTNNIVKIECSQIFSKVPGETEKELTKYFERAVKISPSIILMDDIDILCSKSNSTSDYEKRIVATLALLLDKLSVDDKSVIVLATTTKIFQIDTMLRTSSRFGKEIEIFVPNSSQRFEILNCLLLDVDHDLLENDIRNIADSSHGFVGADLVSLVSKAILKSFKRHQKKEKVSFIDFQWAIGKVKPSAMKEIILEIPNVKWEEIGGQEDLKLKLKQSIEWPLKYGNSFKRLGITPPKGLLMYGPPGCSKTMIAKALATESNLNFIAVKGPELFSKWVGESERAVRKIFRRARQVAPCIIFFDELDAIGGERSESSNSNVQERVLAQMLTELDGVEPLENVTVVAATNRIDRIDPALIRPGRLDRIVYVPLPDHKTRKEIFKIHFKKTCVDEDVSIEELVEKTEGYSGAEVIAVCREAGLKALEENFEAEKINRNHFLEALKIVIPRTSKSILEICEKYRNK